MILTAVTTKNFPRVEYIGLKTHIHHPDIVSSILSPLKIDALIHFKFLMKLVFLIRRLADGLIPKLSAEIAPGNVLLILDFVTGVRRENIDGHGDAMTASDIGGVGAEILYKTLTEFAQAAPSRLVNGLV